MQSINYCIHDEDLQKIECKLHGDASPDMPMLDERDTQAIASMKSHNDDFPILARAAPLDPGSKTVDWTSERGWFDEIVSMSKRRAKEDGWPWTGATEDTEEEDEEEELSNSYRGADIADWDNRQQERDKTLTFAGLPPSLPKPELDVTIPRIESIIDP